MIFTTILYNKDTRSACLLVFLNLHHFKRDSYIAMQMSGLICFIRWKAEGWLRLPTWQTLLGVKKQELHFGTSPALSGLFLRFE